MAIISHTRVSIWPAAYVALQQLIMSTFPILVGTSSCGDVSQYSCIHVEILKFSSLLLQQLFLKGFGGDLGKAYGRASMVAGEAVGNIRTIAAFCAEDKVLDLFIRELEEPKKRTVLRGQLSGIGYGISQFFMYASYGLALWYASTLVKAGEAVFGDVLKVFMVLIITAFGVAETLALAPDIVKGSRALTSIFEILDRQTAIDPDNQMGEEITRINGEIELKHVSFAYPARPDIHLFSNFNLKVNAGKSLALVGQSGSGVLFIPQGSIIVLLFTKCDIVLIYLSLSSCMSKLQTIKIFTLYPYVILPTCTWRLLSRIVSGWFSICF